MKKKININTGYSRRFAVKVASICEDEGIPLGNVLNKVHHGPTYLNKVKRGEQRLYLDDAAKIADVLGIPLSELISKGGP